MGGGGVVWGGGCVSWWGGFCRVVLFFWWCCWRVVAGLVGCSCYGSLLLAGVLVGRSCGGVVVPVAVVLVLVLCLVVWVCCGLGVGCCCVGSCLVGVVVCWLWVVVLVGLFVVLRSWCVLGFGFLVLLGLTHVGPSNEGHCRLAVTSMAVVIFN